MNTSRPQTSSEVPGEHSTFVIDPVCLSIESTPLHPPSVTVYEHDATHRACQSHRLHTLNGFHRSAQVRIQSP